MLRIPASTPNPRGVNHCPRCTASTSSSACILCRPGAICAKNCTGPSSSSWPECSICPELAGSAPPGPGAAASARARRVGQPVPGALVPPPEQGEAQGSTSWETRPGASPPRCETQLAGPVVLGRAGTTSRPVSTCPSSVSKRKPKTCAARLARRGRPPMRDRQRKWSPSDLSSSSTVGPRRARCRAMAGTMRGSEKPSRATTCRARAKTSAGPGGPGGSARSRPPSDLVPPASGVISSSERGMRPRGRAREPRAQLLASSPAATATRPCVNLPRDERGAARHGAVRLVVRRVVSACTPRTPSPAVSGHAIDELRPGVGLHGLARRRSPA